MKMITITEIAEGTGVSISTVSRILNHGSGKLRKDAAKRAETVLSYARLHGYKPNMAAKGLKLKRSFKFGVLVTELANPVRTAMLQKLHEEAQKRGYALITEEVPYTQDIRRPMILDNDLDGLIISHKFIETRLRSAGFLSGLMPTVTFGYAERMIPGNILIDYRGAAREQTLHLIEKHHFSRIVYLGGSKQDPRFAGYAAAMHEHHLEIPEPWLIGKNYIEDSFAKVREQCGGNEIPRALLCHNDLTAVGALSAIGRNGMKVPDDIAVIGFDDIMVAPYLSPPLSSAGIDADRLAHLLIEELQSQIDGNGKHSGSCPVHFHYRQSCGCGKENKLP